MAFSIVHMESFEELNEWFKEVDEKSQTRNMVKVIIGNKCDMPNHEVPYSKGAKYAEEQGAIYYETSAKNGTNVNEVF